MSRFQLRFALLALAVLASPGSARAQDSTPIIPLEHFFDNPEIAGAQISPDGRWISYLKPHRGKLNIHVRAIDATEERVMTADTARPVGGYFWAADASHLLYVQDKGGNENFHVYAVPIAGTGLPEARDLTPFEGVRAIIFAVPEDAPERILVGMNRRTPSAFDAYWLNLESGEATLAVENPGRHGGYLLDPENRVRVAQQQNEQGGTEILFRETEAAPWRTVFSVPADENAGAVRFHPDGRRLYVTTNRGTDLARLILLDLASGAIEEVEGDPEKRVDIGGVSFSDRTDEIIATTYVDDTVRIYARPAWQRDIERLRAVHRGTPNVTSITRDEQKLIVAFDDPVDPGATYLYDRATGTAELLFRPRPWLKSEQLADMTPVSYPARDGLTIHGYLTVPRGAAQTRLPMVLLVHGGPWARDTWGYDPEAQLLANRGYAVLQVNYRGSTGYGKRFYNAAVREFAGKMHDDLVDGVAWAVARGTADPDRVAIYGGSYGGYATLVGLAFTPDVFACGVDYVGPSSLITLINSFPAYWRPFMEGTWFRHVGDPAKEEDLEDLRRRSPLFRVDSIQDPLLIVQGANDPRVTKLEADQLAIALRDRGVRVRYLVAPNEGHGFANPDNRLALYRSMETFLGECLGGRVQESVAPAIDATIARLTVDVDTLQLAPTVSYRALVPGDPAVAGTAITAGVDTFRITLIQAGNEREVGTIVDALTITEANGQPALQRIQTLSSAMLGTGVDSVLVRHADLVPVRHRSRNAQRAMSLDYAGNEVRGSITPTGGTATDIAVRTEGAVFDSNPVDLVIRALPLAPGLAVQIPVYLHEAGGKVDVPAQVVREEPLDGVAAWVVESTMAGRKVTYWIAKADRALLRQDVEAAPNVIVRIAP